MQSELNEAEGKALLLRLLGGTLPDEHGRFGPFGGRYAPETLIPALERLEEVASFAGLRWHREYEQYLSSRVFHDTRNKWRRYLSHDQGELILRFFDRVGGIVPARPEYVTA